MMSNASKLGGQHNKGSEKMNKRDVGKVSKKEYKYQY